MMRPVTIARRTAEGTAMTELTAMHPPTPVHSRPRGHALTPLSATAGPAALRPIAHPAALARGTPAGILALQGAVGNRAVQRVLLARQPAPAEAESATAVDRPLLAAAQVARALGFYRAQPRRYTPAIVAQIQTAVGTAPTGTMTEADVQAVATRQAALNLEASPALKVDGMAGPRTLPAVFKIGLAKDDPLKSYASKAAKMWLDPTQSEEQIANEIANTLMKDRVTAIGMPPPVFKVVDNLGSRGNFRASEWLVTLDRQNFQPGKRHDLKATTETIYHEYRHAEQTFKVGQMLAGKKKTAKQINDRTQLRLDIAEQAVLRPIAPGTMEAVIAEGWDDALNNTARLVAIQNEVKAASNARDAAQKERDAADAAAKADPSPANQARLAKAEAALAKAQARNDKAVAAHDDLPDEVDAGRVGTRVGKEFEKTPGAPTF
jgi:hypothetical protein